MRLIDADNLESLCDIMADKCDGLGKSIWNQFRTITEWLPTIEAVPVVRCKECKHYEEWERGGDCYCTRFSADPYEYLPMEDDDFCSQGERRENATD